MPADAEARIALDTSVAIPLLVKAHPSHGAVRRWLRSRKAAPTLCGHAIAETYSVLTRLPGDLAVTAEVAARLLAIWFPDPSPMPARLWRDLPGILAAHDVSGGGVYDGLVALAAHSQHLPVATRDVRARRTYERLGVTVEFVT